MNTYSNVVGFNYHPSYSWNSYETWRFFNIEIIEKEIALGKNLFPKMNTIRLWLDYTAFRYEEDRFAENIEKELTVCDRYGLKVIVELFNCWHDNVMDAGGVYHPQMIPGSIWCAQEDMDDSYIKKIVKAHKDDERILIWDICNEPFSYGRNTEYREFMEPYEIVWLKKMTDLCHAAGVTQPCGIGDYCSDGSTERMEKIEDFVDIFLIHPYYYYSDEQVKTKSKEGFYELLMKYIDFAKQNNKPILSDETCWGSRDNQIRATIIENTLHAHKKAHLGFVAHALNWSHNPDLHDDSEDPLNFPGNLMFITKDGKIRECHEIFNALLEER